MRRERNADARCSDERLEVFQENVAMTIVQIVGIVLFP